MYKTAVVIIIALMVIVVTGTVLVTNKMESAVTTEETEKIEQVENETKEEEVEEITSTPTPMPEPTEAEKKTEVDDPITGIVCKINPDCDLITEYCLRTNCADQTGVCVKRPTSCPQTLSPVCSCDGKTYSSACSAKESGASIARSGTCSS